MSSTRRSLLFGHRALQRMLEDSQIAAEAAGDIEDTELSRALVDLRAALDRAGYRMAVLRREEFPESGEAA